ncbi:MAG: VOC family protein [Candidatus Thermoplasmatota archaeon]|nr:VOC family protein [Candidatus Thermoplasmatota archaeon]
MRLEHIALTVLDIKQSIEFYENLGFKLDILEHKNDRERAWMTLGDIRLELFCSPNVGTMPYDDDIHADLRTAGIKHLSFEVDDIMDIYSRSKKNQRFLGKPQRSSTGGTYVFFRDCNGIVLEFFERD